MSLPVTFARPPPEPHDGYAVAKSLGTRVQFMHVWVLLAGLMASENAPVLAKSSIIVFFPQIHKTNEQVDPTEELQAFVSEEVWGAMPKIQYRVTIDKKQKCESQLQYSIINNMPVFTTTGTNTRRPGLKRAWAEESEDLRRAIARKREGNQPLENFEPSSSSKRKEIGNSEGEGEPDIAISNSNISSVAAVPISALQKMQSKFRAKFARIQGVSEPQNNSNEGLQQAPANLGQPGEVNQEQAAQPAKEPAQEVKYVRGTRKMACVKVAGVKWGKPKSKHTKPL